MQKGDASGLIPANTKMEFLDQRYSWTRALTIAELEAGVLDKTKQSLQY